MTWIPLLNFDYGVKSCYDRILMPLASLAARGFVIHRQVVFAQCQTLKNAIFNWNCPTKSPKKAYCHCKQFPTIHSTGQGSGNSQAIWCFVSSKLFQCYKDKAHCMSFSSPDGSMTLSMAIIDFVDDTTCMTFWDPSKPLTSMLHQMQEDA